MIKTNREEKESTLLSLWVGEKRRYELYRDESMQFVSRPQGNAEYLVKGREPSSLSRRSSSRNFGRAKSARVMAGELPAENPSQECVGVKLLDVAPNLSSTEFTSPMSPSQKVGPMSGDECVGWRPRELGLKDRSPRL